jgi:hypothetical protein
MCLVSPVSLTSACVCLPRGKPTEQGYLNDARELISTMANPKTGLFNAEGEVSHRSLS